MPFLSNAMIIFLLVLVVISVILYIRDRLSLFGALFVGAFALIYFSVAVVGIDPGPTPRGGPDGPGFATQATIIFGLLIASVLGVASRHFYDKKRDPNASQDPPTPWVLGVIVSLLMSSAAFAPLIEAIFTAQALWPMILPFIAAYEKGFFWPTFVKDLQADKDA